MGEEAKRDDAGAPVAANAGPEHSDAHRKADAAPEQQETYDPYILVDPFDKEEVRRQKRLRRDALRGKVPLRRDEREGAGADAPGAGAGLAGTAGAAPGAGVASDGADVSSGVSEELLASDSVDRALLRARRRTRRALAAVAAVLVLVIVCAGGYALYDSVRAPDFSSYAEQGISVSGLEDEDFIVTPQELSELDCEEVSATGQGRGPQGESRVGAVTAYGPLLDTFLAGYGYSQTDFTRIVFECKDGYTVVLARDALESDVILTLFLSKDELAKSQQPLRLVIPDEASGQWAYGVLRIEVER